MMNTPEKLEIPGFQASVFEFRYTPRATLRLPFYKGGVLRGGFGYAFRNIVCVTGAAKVPGAKDPCRPCILLHQCPYPYLFETPLPPDAEVLRTNRYLPRPFILRPLLSPIKEFQPGEEFPFGLVLAGRALQFLPYFVIAFQRLGERGLGRERTPADLTEVAAIHPWRGERKPILTQQKPVLRTNPLILTWQDILERSQQLPTGQIKVQFLTPARLIHQKTLARNIEFHILLRVILRRISSLAYFHFGSRWMVDYNGLIERAKAVQLVTSDLHWVDWDRWSSRQNQSMNLGGMIGQVTYQGELAEFLPILAAGEILHAGKATTFGHGQYQLHPAP